ncbi:MAG: hypothetical protein GTO51_08650 [Candidatus Latescibacteria bacterium]|nr:hypothetical protein [Candidatus Latescibacterota bacterium]NIM22021.1 hypothetical protein [Candidatus Latescibacterota bacterium]NIM66039.1 hypothetical protein [Candidatus Latescibacterota bacterium]NIO02447.1 hypothetical protein [Candidatus Latescibacterota bacterium]NIO29358.1 hypothetical protein [Candidatus Latescibacterota bacterium]
MESRIVHLRCLAFSIALSALFFPNGCSKTGPPGYQPSHRGARYLYKDRIEFDDGDSFLLSGKPIRILGIDAPEIIDTSVGIFENQPFGIEAAESTKAWILRAKIAEYLPDGKDIYDRILAHIIVDGELLSVKLIHNGLAYETVTTFGDNGFPDLARKILQASLESPAPKFQKPYLWRKKHQRKKR